MYIFGKGREIVHTRVHGADLLDCSEKYAVAEESIIDFSSNVNIFLPELDYEAIFREAMSEVSRYPDLQYRKLRQSLASYYRLSEESIVPGNGASELIYLLMKIEKFQRIGIVQPTFSEYERGAEVAGKQVCSFRFSQIEAILGGEAGISEEVWQDLDCLILCNPNNPTGQIINLEKLPAFLADRGVHLMVDETFIDFMDNRKYSLMDLLPRYSNLSILKAVTKYHALTGLRLGYLFTDNSEFNRGLWELKEPWTVNCVAESAARALFDQRSCCILDEFDKKSSAYYSREVPRVKRIYENYDFVRKVSNSVTNFLLLELEEGFSGNYLKETLFRKHGFLIRTCQDFRGLSDSFIRIGIKEKEKNDRLSEAILQFGTEG